MYRLEKNRAELHFSMQEILTKLELADVKLISVNQVLLNSTCSYAKFVISFLSDRPHSDILAEINKNKSKIRYELGIRIRNRVKKIPVIEFIIDSSIEKAFNIDKIIENLTK